MADRVGVEPTKAGVGAQPAPGARPIELVSYHKGMGLYYQLLNPRTRTAFELGRSPWQNPIEEFGSPGGFGGMIQFRRSDMGTTREEFIELYATAMREEVFPEDREPDYEREVAGQLWDWMDDGVFWLGHDMTFDDVGAGFRFKVTASRYKEGSVIENPPGPLPDHADGRFEELLLQELRKHV